MTQDLWSSVQALVPQLNRYKETSTIPSQKDVEKVEEHRGPQGADTVGLRLVTEVKVEERRHTREEDSFFSNLNPVGIRSYCGVELINVTFLG